MTYSLTALLSSIRIAKLRSLPTCAVSRSNYSLRVLNVLRQNNLVYGATAQSERHATIYLRYFRGKSVFTELKVLSKLSRPAHLSVYELKKFAKRNPMLLFFMTSTIGVTGQSGAVISQRQNKFNRLSGELLLVAW